MEYFDTHAHYNDEKFDGIVDDVLKRCKNIGVKYVINIGYNIMSKSVFLTEVKKLKITLSAWT